ncbi:MAG: pilus assembly protein PilM [Patescibacteria group bacterium]
MKDFFNRYFSAPSYLAMNSCALEISDSSIAYAEIRSTPHGPRLSRFGRIKLPHGAVVAGKIENEKILVKIISNLARKEKIRFVRLVILEGNGELFTLTLPHMDRKDIPDALSRTVVGWNSFEPGAVAFYYRIVSALDTGMIIEVLAVPIGIIKSYLSVCDKAGLMPISFEFGAEARARAVVPDNDSRPVMIVSIGERGTQISIAEKGHVFSATYLDIGGATLSAMIARAFSITFEEAETIRRSHAVGSSAMADDVFQAITDGLAVLGDEIIRRSIDWQTSGMKRRPISRIVVSGTDGNLSGLAEYLERKVKIKTRSADIWISLPAKDSSVPDIPFEESLGYATVVGLARGYSPHSSAFNIVPENRKRRVRLEYRIRIASTVLSCLALVGAVAIVSMLPSYFYSISKARLAEAKLEAFNRTYSEIARAEYDEKIADSNAKLELLSRYGERASITAAIYDPILSRRAEGVDISRISSFKNESGNEIDISGTAGTQAALRSFKEKLAVYPHFSESGAAIFDPLKKSAIDFTIRMKMK